MLDTKKPNILPNYLQSLIHNPTSLPIIFSISPPYQSPKVKVLCQTCPKRYQPAGMLHLVWEPGNGVVRMVYTLRAVRLGIQRSRFYHGNEHKRSWRILSEIGTNH